MKTRQKNTHQKLQQLKEEIDKAKVMLEEK